MFQFLITFWNVLFLDFGKLPEMAGLLRREAEIGHSETADCKARICQVSDGHKKHMEAWTKWTPFCRRHFHYSDVIMGAMASQITSLTIVYWTVNSGADQRKHLSSTSLAFMRGIHRSLVNSPHKYPVTRKMFPFDDVIIFKYIFVNEDVWSLGFMFLGVYFTVNFC